VMVCTSWGFKVQNIKFLGKRNVIWNKNSISCKGLKYLAILILEISSAAADGLVEMVIASKRTEQGFGVCVCVCASTPRAPLFPPWRSVSVEHPRKGLSLQFNLQHLDGYAFASSCVAVRALIG
jgi:hypothetical protein